MKRMSRLFVITGLILSLTFNLNSQSQPQPQPQPFLFKPQDSVALESLDGKFNFIIANDLGRNGYYDQKPVAEMMGETAGLAGAEFVAANGDVHHFMGVQSVSDPLWLTNFEWVYSHPELMIPWYPTLGNHEYRGNTQAVLDYSKISKRWQMPASYYSKSFQFSDKSEVLLVFINTAPLIDKYRKETADYPDAVKENLDLQIKWIDETLKNSNAKWKIVLGHHPVYAGTTKDINEQTDLQKRIDPILIKNNVHLYFAGHIHNFQHIKVNNSPVDYFVNTSASLTRKVVKRNDMAFSSSDSGFILCSVEDNQIIVSCINKTGKIIYQYIKK